MKKIFTILCLLATTLSFANTTTEKSDTAKSQKKIAIFVRNASSDNSLSQKTDALEAELSARLNASGLNVIDRSVAIGTLDDYLKNTNAKDRKVLETVKNSIAKNNSCDVTLFELSSVQRIAEVLGADNILAVSLTSMQTDKATFKGYGIETKNTKYTLRSSYNIFDTSNASSVTGGIAEVSESIKQTQNLSVEKNQILDSLIDASATEIASLIKSQFTENKIVSTPTSQSSVQILCNVADLAIPEIIHDNGKYSISNGTIPVSMKYVTVEVDGISANANEPIKLSKGIHVVRISQQDIEPFEKTINVTGENGQIIAFNLRLTDEARNKIKADMAFVESLKNKAKLSDDKRTLTEAEAEKLKGIGKMFEQSGYRIDAKNLPEYKNVQSIFAQ